MYVVCQNLISRWGKVENQIYLCRLYSREIQQKINNVMVALI